MLPWAAPAWVWFMPALWLATAWVCIDLTGQRDEALAEVMALRTRVAQLEAALSNCRDQSRALASRPTPICQPPQPCPRGWFRRVWEGE